MYKQKICLGLTKGYELPYEEQIALFHKTGFEEFFIDACGRDADIGALVRKGKEESMGVQSVHAPFNRSDDMWNPEGELGEIAVTELLSYLEECARYEVPIMVTHVWLGFEYDDKPNECGIERYGRLVKRADELGVKLALENTEGEEFLETLLTRFKDEKSVGFCWDSGHEQCYSFSRDLLKKYGHKLFCTHLNDNLGIRDYDGKITFVDDLHLLPFDGIIDWENVGKRLADCGFDGTLTFELKRICRTGRRENFKYEAMKPEDYVTAAYERACRVAFLKLKAEERKNG